MLVSGYLVKDLISTSSSIKGLVRNQDLARSDHLNVVMKEQLDTKVTILQQVHAI